MTRNHAVNPGMHSHAERGNDLYSTPPVATEALLRVEKLPPCIWEPAAGRGAIVKVLSDAGHDVIAYDLIDYGFPLHRVVDFLSLTKAPAGCDCILTNPPNYCMNAFIAHALDLCPRVIMLAPVKLIGSAARTEILEHRGLARVHAFRERLNGMHRDGWAGKKASSAIEYAWWVWDREHRGPTTLHRISR
jgi:hypothetical protein